MSEERKISVRARCNFCGEKYEADSLDSVEAKLCLACAPKVQTVTVAIREFVKIRPGVSVDVVCREFGVKRKFVMDMLREHSLQTYDRNQ